MTTTYTNHKDYGGDFGKEIRQNFSKHEALDIATGYFGVPLIKNLWNELIDIAKRGHCRILIGMIYHEGVTKLQKHILTELDKALKAVNGKSGVYVSLHQYHGKIYRFNKEGEQKIYVGSSNFSDSGFQDNYEFNALIIDPVTKERVSAFIDYLFIKENELSAPLVEVELTEKKTRTGKTKPKRAKSSLDTCFISPSKFPAKPVICTIKIKLRVDKQPLSSLNLYFEKGRKNKNGKYSPRPWYEVEITSTKAERAQDGYPLGEFNVFVIDEKKHYQIPMITASDDYKAITSKNNRAILGELIKGKLERLGHLARYERITSEILDEYGRDYIELKKFADGKYYLDF